MDDDFDLEAFAAEADQDLRERIAAGDPVTRRQILQWCQGAAQEIIRFVPHGSTRLEAPDETPSPEIEEADWRYQVYDDDLLLVEFRADATWTSRNGRTRSWFGIIEGSPESIGQSIARDLGLPNRPLHPRRTEWRYGDQIPLDESGAAPSDQAPDPYNQTPLF